MPALFTGARRSLVSHWRNCGASGPNALQIGFESFSLVSVFLRPQTVWQMSVEAFEGHHHQVFGCGGRLLLMMILYAFTFSFKRPPWDVYLRYSWGVYSR